jgi:hypothetical protein
MTVHYRLWLCQNFSAFGGDGQKQAESLLSMIHHHSQLGIEQSRLPLAKASGS